MHDMTITLSYIWCPCILIFEKKDEKQSIKIITWNKGKTYDPDQMYRLLKDKDILQRNVAYFIPLYVQKIHLYYFVDCNLEQLSQVKGTILFNFYKVNWYIYVSKILLKAACTASQPQVSVQTLLQNVPLEMHAYAKPITLKTKTENVLHVRYLRIKLYNHYKCKEILWYMSG